MSIKSLHNKQSLDTMKVLFEVPIKAEDKSRSSFTWLANKHNWFFTIEDGKRMKTWCSDNEPGKELHSATLTESRVCTSFSWNKDGTLLALVVDQRQIYFWDIKTNNFSHFKPVNKPLAKSSTLASSSRKTKQAHEIDLVCWSKVSNRFALVYSTAQMLLCDCDEENFSEKFIDNCDGILKKVSFFASCDRLDLFVCVTEISEILVMTFDGEPKVYIQSEAFSVVRAKFSPVSSFRSTNKLEEIVWLSLQSGSGRLFFKRILLHEPNEEPTGTNVVYTPPDGCSESRLVDFHWLGPNQLIACFESGRIDSIRISQSLDLEPTKFDITTGIILDMNQEDNGQSVDAADRQVFKSFEFNDHQDASSFSLAAISNYKLYYYELSELDTCNKFSYACEKVDEVDLTGSLTKVRLELEQIKWSPDHSKLAVQLSNNHILVYRTRLQDYMVSSHGNKSAYLSALNEITVLNYGCDKIKTSSADESDDDGDAGSSNALTINVRLKPSIIAIGPNHLAVALNNRVQFYTVDPRHNKMAEKLLVDEQEYASIVVAIQLCSRFVAVHFDDGRLKLHAIKLEMVVADDHDGDDFSDLADERFFPDPARPERISAFSLSELVFVYCSHEMNIHVFSLKHWSPLQSCNHSAHFDWPISRLKADERGNKFVCLAPPSTTASRRLQDTVYLYDLYSNNTISLFDQTLWVQIRDSQLETNEQREPIGGRWSNSSGRVTDAIWDTDGRTVLLIERKYVHVVAVLSHTLEREAPLAEYVATSGKPSSYTTLYVSHGIVSFQTALGRIINTVLESHDEDLKLARLEQQISRLRESGDTDDAKSRALRLKLAYLESALPVYPLSRCKEICEHLTTNEELGCEDATGRRVLWQLLAAWALFTLNPNFASMIYRKHGPAICARTLRCIARGARTGGVDTKAVFSKRLLDLLLICRQSVQ